MGDFVNTPENSALEELLNRNREGTRCPSRHLARSSYVFYLGLSVHRTLFGLGQWAVFQRRPDVSARPTILSMSTRSVTTRGSVVWAPTRSSKIMTRATVSMMCAHETSRDAYTHRSTPTNVSMSISNLRNALVCSGSCPEVVAVSSV